jgi:hypothetical protein
MAAAVVFGNIDQITLNVAQAQAEMAVGTNTVQVIEKGAGWLVKLLIGGMVTGVAVAVYADVRKAIKTWQRNSRVRRWAAGPNAQWQPSQNQLPKLRREDLMLLALTGRMPSDNPRPSPTRGSMRVQDDEEEVNLEMPS